MLASDARVPLVAGHRVASRPRLRRPSNRDVSRTNRQDRPLRRCASPTEPVVEDEDAEYHDETYGATIETILVTEAAYPPFKRMTRWVKCLSACAPVVGGCDFRFVEVKSSKHGAGVFAKTDIPRRTVLGNYPGVRRSLSGYTKKAERTNGKVLSYGLMCKDGWVLDPTNEFGEVGVGGFEDDRSESSSSASSSSSTIIASPTVSLPLNIINRDATLCLANEPDGPDDEDGDLLRERNANIGVKEGEIGKQAVYALRAIRKGEELLWDYGASYNREHY